MQPVVSETYDEIVFNDLHTFSPSIREQVIRGPKKQEEEHEGQEYHKEFSPEEDLRAIAQAHAFVTAETESKLPFSCFAVGIMCHD